MDLITSVVFVIVGLAGVSLLAVIALVVRRLTGRSWLGAATALLAATAAVGGVVGTFAARARTVEGRVLVKEDQIFIDDAGFAPSIVHQLHVTVEVDEPAGDGSPGGRRQALNLRVSEPVFDSLREGQTLEARYLALGPIKLLRLPAQGWWDELRIVAAFAYAPEDSAQRRETQAVVEKLRTMREALVLRLLSGVDSQFDTERVTLRQPYEELQLRFVTEDGRSIVAIDRIDAGSAGPLAVGQSVEVSYAPDAPRQAKLTRGARDHLWANRIDHYGGRLAGFGLSLALVIALLWWLRLRIVRKR